MAISKVPVQVTEGVGKRMENAEVDRAGTKFYREAVVLVDPELDVDGANWGRVRGANPSATEAGLVVRPIERQPTAAAKLAAWAGAPNVGVADVILAPANAARLRLVIINEATQDDLLVSEVGVASASNYTWRVLPRQTLVLPWPTLTGQINAIREAGSGNVMVTEET